MNGVFDLTLEELAPIFRRNGLPLPASIVRVQKGVTNPTFFVNETLVVRVNYRDPHIPKFDRESKALELARKAGCSAPRVVFVDNSLNPIQYPVLCTERAPGEPLDERWKSLTSSQKQKVGHSFGVKLARLDVIKLDNFGDLLQPELQFESWSLFLSQAISERLEGAERYFSIPHEHFLRTERALQDLLSAFTYQEGPRLTHGDYRPSNVTVDNFAVTAIFDFEWALAGDPEYDFRVIDNCVRKALGIWDFLKEGYESVQPLSNEFPRKVLLYQLIWRIGITTLAKRFWGEVIHAECVERLNELLDTIESGGSGPSLYPNT